MIGLMFLGAGLLWLSFAVFLSVNVPKWLGFTKRPSRGLLSLTILLLLTAGLFVDEWIGMQQFEQLCRERTIVQVSPDADKVTRAKDANLPIVELPGYWIKIQSQPVALIDVDTGKIFLKYDILSTKGGRIAGIALLGGKHQCVPEDRSATKRLNVDRLLQQGIGK